MLSLLAQRWRSDYIAPASGLTGYWNVDEPAIFDLIGLSESPATTRCAFWLEPTSPAKLHPLSLQNRGQSFYLEVQAVTVERLRLALWVKHSTNMEFSHRLTYTLLLAEVRCLGIE